MYSNIWMFDVLAIFLLLPAYVNEGSNMQPSCDVCLSVSLSVLLLVIGMHDKHPPGVCCNFCLTGEGTTDIRSN